MKEGNLCCGFWYHGILKDVSGEVYEGPLRLVLTLGELFDVCTGGPTDEGYSNSTTRYIFDRDENGKPVLTREWHIESRDCDGRYEQSGVDIAVELEVVPDYYDPDVKYPMWDKVPKSYRQRDYTAEAMGY
jgi:hypothetical protein